MYNNNTIHDLFIITNGSLAAHGNPSIVVYGTQIIIHR